MLNTKSQTVSSTSTDHLKFNPELFKVSKFLSVCCRCQGEFFYTLPSQYCKICYYEYIKELQDDDERLDVKHLEKKERKTFKKLTEEEQLKKAKSYGNIKLIFCKYKNFTLDKIADHEKGVDYLRWLYGSMKKDEKKKSPTQMAIMNYIFNVVGI